MNRLELQCENTDRLSEGTPEQKMFRLGLGRVGLREREGKESLDASVSTLFLPKDE